MSWAIKYWIELGKYVCMYFFRSRRGSIVSSGRMGTRGQKLVALQKKSNSIEGGLLKMFMILSSS